VEKVRVRLVWTALFGAVFCLNTVPVLGRAEGVHPREKLGGYTTYYSQNDGGRCRNIALAAEKIDGIALQPYGEFSFNALVGKRTKENGFLEAKVISQGEFVKGVGGGVCQVSSTLYNAALLSGLSVTEYHPHSLAVGYIAPSRDAMVSSESDLKLFNPFPQTVYFSAQASGGALTVVLRGEKTQFSYEIESKKIEEWEGMESGGVKSEAYLKTYQNGVLVGVKKIRTDTYAPVKGKIIILP
jgi:vancomycin resistance protein YoaR